jgi:hypothetical protein
MAEMNYPTSDIQFLAEMVNRTRRGDQITGAEGHRLDVLRTQGHSSSADEEEVPASPVVHPPVGSGQV